MISFDNLKTQFESEMKQNRFAWRLTIIPQLVVIFFLLIASGMLAIYGLYISISHLASGESIASFEKAAKVFVTGSSSLLGFVVIKVFSKATDLSALFIKEERWFTSLLSRARITESAAELTLVVKEYGKKTS